MKTIYLVRHGKASLKGSDRGRGLTEEGELQSKQISKQLNNFDHPIENIFTSAFQRAILFIKPFSEIKNINIVELEEFREIKLSSENIENMNKARQNMWSDFSKKLVGGESGSEAQTRGLSGLKKVLNIMLDGSSSVVVSHGNLIGLIIHSFDKSFGFEHDYA
jgi:2,3-bisphosphoglycerate-dependent phosphoglycerate mutase